MVIKIIFVLLCATLGAYVGIYFKKRVDKKSLYFKDALSFCEYFKHDLTYKQSKLKALIAEYSYLSEDFRKDIQSFSENFQSNIKLADFLLANEKNEIRTFFDSLGKVDINTQLSLLEENKSRIESLVTKYKTKSEKEGKLFVKLGLLGGLCLGVLLA